MKLKFKYEWIKPQYLLFILLWPLIILPKQISLVCFFALTLFLYATKGFKIAFDNVSIAMISLFLVQGTAILYNIIFLESEVNRIPAAINTASLWLITGLLSAYYGNQKVDLKIIGKICVLNAVILFGLDIITIYMYYFRKLPAFVMLGRTLYGTTFLDGAAEVKFIGLNEFSNMNLFMIMLITMLMYPYIIKKSRLFKFVMITGVTISVLLIHSRSGYVLFFVSLLFMLYDFVPKKYKKIVIAATILAGVMVCVVGHKQIYNVVYYKIINGNTSSNSLRKEIMFTSIEEALEKSPIIGMGIKRYLYTGYPLGSHSSYVGFFYKTGILGFSIGIYIFIKANFRVIIGMIKTREFRPMLFFLICFFVLFAIEDIDGANWSIMLYFSTLEIMNNAIHKCPNGDQL